MNDEAESVSELDEWLDRHEHETSVSLRDQYRLWLRGDPSYLLHSGQEEIREHFYSTDAQIFVLLCSRRYGKSILGCALGLEMALSTQAAEVRVGAPTGKQVRQILRPHMGYLLQDCPDNRRPKYDSMDGVWHFDNGSLMAWAGCEKGGADRLRGTSADLGIIEEGGMIDEVDYLIDAVLLPQMLTTDGRIVIPTSPPLTPVHPVMKYIEQARKENALIHRTIYDAPHIPREVIERHKEQQGGDHSVVWRREYMAEIVVDDTMAVVPEFSDECVTEVQPPPYRHRYVAMDVGYTDLTVALLGYLHWDLASLVVEDEIVCHHQTSEQINRRVAEAEARTWGTEAPVLRVVDAPQIVVADLCKERPWMAAHKDDADAALNRLRVKMSSQKILIHPRCTTTISHLKYAIWNRSRTSFERSADMGHFDAIDALKYLVRHTQWHRNPYPKYYDLPGPIENLHIPDHEDPQVSQIRAALAPQRRRSYRSRFRV